MHEPEGTSPARGNNECLESRIKYAEYPGDADVARGSHRVHGLPGVMPQVPEVPDRQLQFVNGVRGKKSAAPHHIRQTGPCSRC